jgi:hypothetical protein
LRFRAGNIAGDGNLRPIEREQFRFGVPEHAAQGRVDLLEPAVSRDQSHAEGGVLESGSEVLVALLQGEFGGFADGVVFHVGDQCEEASPRYRAAARLSPVP